MNKIINMIQKIKNVKIINNITHQYIFNIFKIFPTIKMSSNALIFRIFMICHDIPKPCM